MGMNSARGYHHKAVKGKPAGGHFNSSVNIVRSRFCRLSKQYIEDALKSSNGAFWKGFLRANRLDSANRVWTCSLINSEED